MRRFLPIATLALLPFIPAWAGPDCADLVRRLGSESWQEREAAQVALIDAGEEALAALEEAQHSTDAEVRVRAREAIQAIRSGLSGRAYAEFGNIARSYPELEPDQRRALIRRLQERLESPDLARPLARLATLETEEGLRSELIDGALRADAEIAAGEFRARLKEKRDDLLLVGLVSWYHRAGRVNDALALLDEHPGLVNLPLPLARGIAAIHAGNRDWRRAAETFGILAARSPWADEGDAAGLRIAWLHLAGDTPAAEAGIALALKADAGVRDTALAHALSTLRSEGRRREAMDIVAAGQAAAAGGQFMTQAGTLLFSEGRDAEALLLFRRAILGAQDDASKEMLMEDARQATEGRSTAGVIDPAFLKELQAPSAGAARHAAAAEILSGSGIVGAAATEWKRAATLQPGSPLAAAQAARAARAAGDPGAGAWTILSLTAGGTGWPEEMLAAAPRRGRPALPVVRKALLSELEGEFGFHATAGDVAAASGTAKLEVVGFSTTGNELWRWTWRDRELPLPPTPPSARRTRRCAIVNLLSLGDAFLVGLQEWDTVDFGGEEETREAGGWLVVLDASTGLPRSTARSASAGFSSARPAIARAGILVSSDPDLTCLRGVSITSGRTLWVRALHRYTPDRDPDRIECRPRLAAWGDLVIAPSPHGLRVHAVRIADGSEAWATPLEGAPTDVRVTRDALYVAAGPLAARLDPATGTVAWVQRQGAAVLGAPAQLGDIAAIRTRDGWLRGLNATDGLPRWSTVLGPPGLAEWVEPVGDLFFVCRHDAATWVVTRDGTPLRRLYLDSLQPPSEWLGTLLCDDTFGRRRPFHAPPHETLSQSYVSGLLRVDAEALLADDAGRIAAIVATSAPEAAAALSAAALGVDPESPAALLLRARTALAAGPAAAADPAVRASALNDLWRALDALPPGDPLVRDLDAVLRELDPSPSPLPLEEGIPTELWVRERRFWNAAARLGTGEADREAALALGELGFAAALPWLADRPGQDAHNEAAAVARLRLGDAEAMPAVLAILGAGGKTAPEAAEALSDRTEDAALQGLKPFLAPGNPVRIRLAAGFAWGARGEAAALEAVEQLGLPSNDAEQVLRAARVLLGARRERAIEPILRRARELSLEWAVYEMVGASGVPGSVDALEKRILDAAGDVDVLAIRVLLAHAPVRAHEVLGAALRDRRITGDAALDVAGRLVPGEHPDVAGVVADLALAALSDRGNAGRTWLRILAADSCDVAGRGAAARLHLDAYAQLFPDNASYNNNSAWFRAIALTPELRDAKGALAGAATAVGMEPDNASYWDTLAEALRCAGDLDAALSAAARALELAPASGDTCDVAYCTRQLTRIRMLQVTRGATDGRTVPPGAR